MTEPQLTSPIATAFERRFVGWDRPLIPAAATLLLEELSDEGDLREWAVVLPGARAGRRLLEALTHAAERRNLPLLPPRILTPRSVLPTLLALPREVDFASELTLQLAWARALAEAAASDPSRLASLFPGAPDPGDSSGLARWLPYASLLTRLATEIAAEGHDFASVAAQVDDSRFEVAAWLQDRYREVLAASGVVDLDLEVLDANREPERNAVVDRMVLVGLVDLGTSLRELLRRRAETVTALIGAPFDRAEDFDAFGALDAHRWSDMRCPIPDFRVHFTSKASDQVDIVLGLLAQHGRGLAPDEVTIVLPDAKEAPDLRRALARHGIPAHDAQGRPLRESGPFRLLEQIEEWSRNPRFESFAALVRHPDLAGFWKHAAGVEADALLPLLDRYRSEHLPERLPARWRPLEKRDVTPLESAHRALESALEFLDGVGPLGEWARPISELLITLYGSEADAPTSTVTAELGESLRQLVEVLEAFLEVPTDRGLDGPVGGSDALRILLRELEGRRVADPETGEAVELLGWLEAPFDDAALLIATSMQEGIVPRAPSVHPLLTERVRRELGLVDDQRRLARDRFATTFLSRAIDNVHWVAPRRDLEGDPRLLSRLLLADQPERMARRVSEFLKTETQVAAPPPDQPGEFEVPRPAPLREPITSLSVTAFRNYLGCPYRFYLRHVLRLDTLSDDIRELDARGFGNLAHLVLREFGRSPIANSNDPVTIERFLVGTLEEKREELFGDEAFAAVELQLAQLRVRFEAFAVRQAERARDGWHIVEAELKVPEERAILDVDGRPFVLRGTIDRIDRHAITGHIQVLDYKTGDSAKSPKKAHLNRKGWVDLQLPLYAYLVEQLGFEEPIEVGYFLLPKSPAKVGVQIAEFTEEEQRSAMEEAAAVVRGLRDEVFWPPTEPPPPFAEVFSPICQDGLLVAGHDDRLEPERGEESE